jgi:Zn-dependent peptidase ImmA (M78 family)
MSFNPAKHRNPFFENVNEDPEYEVKRVLVQIGWDGSIPIDLLEICDVYDFEVRFSSIPDMKEAGTTKFLDNGDFYILINTHNTDCIDGFSTNQTELRRQRFTLAHEIGHCIYKSHTDINLQKNLQNLKNPHSKSYVRQRENQSNLFAAHLLIPREAFKKVLRITTWRDAAILIQQVSESFNVSIQVAIQHIARLAEFPCIAILFNVDGVPIRTPSYSSDFTETGLFYGKDQALPSGTLANQMLNGNNSNQHDKKKYRNASTWFPDIPRLKAERFSVVETSIKIGQYGIASFLEIEELDN